MNDKLIARIQKEAMTIQQNVNALRAAIGTGMLRGGNVSSAIAKLENVAHRLANIDDDEMYVVSPDGTEGVE